MSNSQNTTWRYIRSTQSVPDAYLEAGQAQTPLIHSALVYPHWTSAEQDCPLAFSAIQHNKIICLCFTKALHVQMWKFITLIMQGYFPKLGQTLSVFKSKWHKPDVFKEHRRSPYWLSGWTDGIKNKNMDGRTGAKLNKYLSPYIWYFYKKIKIFLFCWS